MEILKRISVFISVFVLISGPIQANEWGQLFDGRLTWNSQILNVAMTDAHATEFSKSQLLFDYGLNTDIDIHFSSRLFGHVHLETGSSESLLGLGTEMAGDVHLAYYEDPIAIKIGSIDLPVTQFMGELTDQASVQHPSLFINPFMVASISGETSSPSLVGGNVTLKNTHESVTIALGNGIHSTRQDGYRSQAAMIGVQTSRWIPQSIFSFSVLRSYDPLNHSQLSNYQHELNTWILDGSSTYFNPFTLKAAIQKYSINVPDTAYSNADSWMVEVSYPSEKVMTSIRWSEWRPTGDSRSSLPTLLPTMTFVDTANTNTSSIQRLQIGMGYPLTDDITVRGEIIKDSIAKSRDIHSYLFSMSTRF